MDVVGRVVPAAHLAARCEPNLSDSYREQAGLLRCIFGNPHRPLTLPPSLLTDSIVHLASAIYHDRAWDQLPILADALEENGVADEATLAHCRVDTLHARGCHVVDAILGKE
jgi:hypothetical protein